MSCCGRRRWQRQQQVAAWRAVAATVLFFLVNFEQSGVWFTFAPIPDITKEYYGISDFELNLLANWGAVMYLLVMPFSGKLAARPGGTYHVAIMGASIVFTSTLLRTVSVVQNFSRQQRRVAVHVAAILNACAGPMAMGVVSQAAADYVPLSFRNTAVGIMYLGQNLGNAVQGLLSPALVHNVESMPRVSIAQACGTGCILMLTLIFLPRPLRQARHSSAVEQWDSPLQSSTESSYWQLAHSKHMWLLALSGALAAGCIAGQGALLSQFCTLRAPGFHTFTDAAAGQASFGQSCMLCVGNALGGFLGDAWCPNHLSWLACGAKATSTLLILLLALCVPLWSETAPLLQSVPQALVAGTIILQGLFDGICDPQNFQLAALVTRPAPSSLSAAIMTWAFNFATLVILSLVPLLGCASIVNWLAVGMNAVATASYLMLEEAKHRQQASLDDSHKQGVPEDPRGLQVRLAMQGDEDDVLPRPPPVGTS